MASSRNSRSTEDLENALRVCLTGLPQGSKVGVALSGGLDSSVLLALLARNLGGHQLSAIHIHHGLSPHADAWAAFCNETCTALAVSLQVVHVSVPRKAVEGLEAAARRLRYQAFDACSADYILLAHHANDQAETLLFNLMRGAGVRGAAGIPAITHRYLRPLLSFSRMELEICAADLGLRWVDDESNDDVNFSRNFIRHKVVPVLQERFPAAVESLARSAEYFAEAQDMLDEMARHDLGACQDFPVPVAVLAGISEPRARNVLRYLLAVRGLQAPVSRRLEEVLRQFIEAAPDRHPSLDLPAYRLFRTRGRVDIEVR